MYTYLPAAALIIMLEHYRSFVGSFVVQYSIAAGVLVSACTLSTGDLHVVYM